MHHDVASATQTVKSEKKGVGGGGGEGGISCEMDKGDRSERGSVYVSCPKGNYVCALKATTYWYATNSQNPSKAVVKMLAFCFKFIDKFSALTM